MCGITGIYGECKEGLDTLIREMRDVFPYRGPDDKGVWIDSGSGVALGHRRLSILDTSSAGHQPMSDPNENLIIVYNGEVYNYLELKKILEAEGYSFKTGTDTEVIIAAYDRWGEDCLHRFNGMFAFAIWDKRKKQLFIARDRMGIKPLYYFYDGKKFLFASEVKAILKAFNEKPGVELSLIDYYMSFGYVPGENTIFTGIKKLLPGHYLIFDGNNLIQKKYWDLTFNNHEDQGLRYYTDTLKDLLNSSIDFRLRSDVPLGIFLSGGIDSSAVVALLAPRVTERLKTFSVAYNFGSDYNETNYARIVANQFNTDHHEFIVSPDDFRDFIPQYVYYMDEPVTESAAISLYYIAKLAKDYVTVVLSGEGSDELFAGYDFYFYNSVIEKYRTTLGEKAASNISGLLSSLLPYSKINKYLRLTQLPLKQRYKGISTYEEKDKERLYTSEFANYLIQHDNNAASEFLNDLFIKTGNNDVLSRMLYFDMKTWLVDDLLIKADKMSMAPSLELRVPFLDYRVAEFAATIPSKYKLNGRTTKYILKKMLEGILPKEIIYRKKMGFPTPLNFLFKKELFGYAQETLLSQQSAGRGYFRADEVKRVLNEHKKGTKDNHRLIWQLIVLEEWHRRFID